MTISQWLEENISSHTVYGIAALADFPDGVLHVGRDRAWLTLGVNGARRVDIPVQSVASVQAEMEADPRGGTLDTSLESDELMFAGWRFGSVLCTFLTGDAPGASLYGRGSGYRANLAAIRRWEDSQ